MKVMEYGVKEIIFKKAEFTGTRVERKIGEYKHKYGSKELALNALADYHKSTITDFKNEDCEEYSICSYYEKDISKMEIIGIVKKEDNDSYDDDEYEAWYSINGEVLDEIFDKYRNRKIKLNIEVLE